MLIAMRRGAAGWVAKILFGLLILSFAAWGIGDYLKPDANPIVAEVGGIEIRRANLDQAERRQIDQMRRMLGGSFDANALPENMLRNAALEQLIGQAALDTEAREMGLAVSDEAIGAAIRANPQFQTAGRFDASLFRRSLLGAGTNEDSYVADLRTELKRAQLGGAVAALLPPPLPLAEALFQIERQKRVVAYVKAATADVTSPEPTEADLKQFTEANAERFAEPERRNIRAIVVSTEAVVRAAKVSEAELQNRYEDTKDNFIRPERRTLVQALFQADDEARAFVATAPTDAAAFKTLAETVGAAVTDLGELSQQELFPNALAKAAFVAPQAGITQPVKTALGWHVLLVAEIHPAATAPFADVRDALDAAMRHERAETGLVTIANAVEDALASGGDLAAASKAADLPITEFKGVDRRGDGANGDALPGMPEDPAFLAAAFERRVGEQSGLIELQDGVFTALIVDADMPSQPKPFEQVRAEAADAWRQEKRQEIAATRVAALMDATSQAAFEEAAKTSGLTVATTELQDRGEMTKAGVLPAALIETIFATPQHRVAKIETADAVVAAFVSDVSRPNFDPTGVEEKAYLSELAKAQANDRVMALANVARAAHPPKISNAAMARFQAPVAPASK